jgi:tetratricopeptide (TPR) repeat protein
MAKRHPTRRRIVAEKPAEPDDAFVAGVFELSTWARMHSQLLILAGVALALLAGGVVYYATYRSALNRDAVTELERVQQIAMFVPDQAEAELARYLQRFQGTRHAAEARLILGQLHLSLGRPQQAILVLEEGPRRARDPIGLQSRTLLGRAYEEVGRWQDAEAQYLSVADAAQLDFQRRDALADAARTRTRRGDHAGAAELYGRIVNALEEAHPDRARYEMRMAEAQHLAQG